MSTPRTARRWIWAALALQLAGFVYDAIWHGLLHPGVEPQSRGDMIVHLTAVHLPLYLGVLAVLLTTVWTFAEAMLQQRAQRCPPSCQPTRDRGAFGGERYGPPIWRSRSPARCCPRSVKHGMP